MSERKLGRGASTLKIYPYPLDKVEDKLKYKIIYALHYFLHTCNFNVYCKQEIRLVVFSQPPSHVGVDFPLFS